MDMAPVARASALLQHHTPSSFSTADALTINTAISKLVLAGHTSKILLALHAQASTGVGIFFENRVILPFPPFLYPPFGFLADWSFATYLNTPKSGL